VGLERAYLEPDTMLVALPHGHADGAVSLAGLRERPWASARAGTAYADMFDRLCRSVGGFEPDVRHRVNDLELLLSLVAGGRAAAIVPALGRPDGHGVGVHPIAEGRFTRALFIATRASDRARPSTGAVVDALSRAGRR
jgi:DNA-binding transcriptional LysR family regulator